MELWKVWLCGIIIAIVERIAVTIIYEKNKCPNVSEFIEVLIQLFIIASIVIVCGVPASKFVGFFYDEPIWKQILITIIPAFVIYFFGFLALGLYNIKSNMLQVMYVLAFIIGTIGLTGEVINYNKYVEEVTETVIEQKQERNLVSFGNISISELSDKTFDGEENKDLKGLLQNIPTSSVIPFCYIDENNQKVSDSALRLNCAVQYIIGKGKPHVEIYSYYKYTKIVDHENGTVKIKPNSEERWNEYTFYLPQAILNYTFKQS